MIGCKLSHIPSRLHQKGRPIIDKFFEGEFLYYRCKPEDRKNPYMKISITELSHNRSGEKSNILCNKDDVLLCIKENVEFEKYDALVVCPLKIINLTPEGGFRRVFEEEKNGIKYVCIMTLIHDPVECMYPHSVFRIQLDGEIVNYENYKNKMSKLKIKDKLKHELSKMIIQEEIYQYPKISKSPA